MLAIIIYGYFLMLIVLGMCIFLPLIFCVLVMKSSDEMKDELEEENDAIFENMNNVIGGEMLISYRNQRRNSSRNLTFTNNLSQSHRSTSVPPRDRSMMSEMEDQLSLS